MSKKRSSLPNDTAPVTLLVGSAGLKFVLTTVSRRWNTLGSEIAVRAMRRRRNLQTLSPDQQNTRADPVILGRLRHLLAVIGPTIGNEFSADWLAQAMSRVDGGPVLDPPRLGPSLRKLDFVPVRRRRGDRRVTVWLAPGAARPRRGRPVRPGPTGDRAMRWRSNGQADHQIININV